MEKPKELIETLVERGEEYGKTTLELIKLKAIDKSSDVVSTMVSWLIVILFAIMFFTLLNIAIALWLGGILGHSWYGFLTVAGFYGLLMLVFWVFRKQLVKKSVNNSIVKQLLD
jgi:hypothetical protein